MLNLENNIAKRGIVCDLYFMKCTQSSNIAE